jgi:UDP-glucose 4-epimerase
MQTAIIGGTGTLGHALVSELISRGEYEGNITIISRDELKQSIMRRKWPGIRYVLGDVRDKDRMLEVIDHDTVFYAAALKQVDTVEANVSEAIKTNVIGSMNVADACRTNFVHDCIFCSTDKAVLPINAYGYTKGLSEKYFLSLNNMKGTHFTVCRWANIIGSRGSAIPLFVNQIKEGIPITLTDERMSRLWMLIEDAAKFMLDTYPNKPTTTQIPKMKAAPVISVIEAIARILDKPWSFKTIGIRPGEKIHETLWTSHEKCIKSNDEDIQYSMDELITLLKPIVEAL